MTFNTDAIVLKILKTGESDRLVTFLTKDRGIYKAFAKAADRPKNKLHMSTNMFCYGNYTFFEGVKASKVEECELNETFFGLQSDITKLALAQYFNELILETAPVESDAEDYLRLLLNSLFFLSENKKDINILKSIFELRLISVTGYMPQLIACAECGTFETDKMFFDIHSGELYCDKCAEKGITELPLEVVSAMRHIVYSELSKLWTLQISDENLNCLNGITEKYLLENFHKKFKALEFFRQCSGT